MAKFGVWYDDGKLDGGWLAEEGRHGRTHRGEYFTLEDAREVAERQSHYDPDTIFYAAPLDSDHEKLFKIVRKLAKEKRLSKAEKELKAAKKSLAHDDDDPEELPPTSFERVLADDD